jgi:hypothetical protein
MVRTGGPDGPITFNGPTIKIYSQLLPASDNLGNLALPLDATSGTTVYSALDWLTTHSALERPLQLQVPKGVPFTLNLRGLILSPLATTYGNVSTQNCKSIDANSGIVRAFNLYGKKGIGTNTPNAILMNPFVLASQSDYQINISQTPYSVPTYSAANLPHWSQPIGTARIYCNDPYNDASCGHRDLVQFKANVVQSTGYFSAYTHGDVSLSNLVTGLEWKAQWKTSSVSSVDNFQYLYLSKPFDYQLVYSLANSPNNPISIRFYRIGLQARMRIHYMGTGVVSDDQDIPLTRCPLDQELRVNLPPSINSSPPIQPTYSSTYSLAIKDLYYSSGAPIEE